METSTKASGPVIRVFGGVGVDDASGPVSIGGPKQRRLLALLAIRAGTVVTVDWLAEYLWDDDERPEATAPAIRTYLSRLRQALPEAARDWIATEPSGYRLDAPVDAVEHLRFAQLRAEATRAREHDDPLTAHTLLDEALDSWRGEPFRDLEDLDWAHADIERLNLERLEMLEERWETALALGRHTQITGELAAFTAEHGTRDRAVQQHSLALHRSGRTPEALRVVADHRRLLADESGLDPSKAMLDLEKSLFTDDPSLVVEKVGRPLRGYRLLEEAGSGAFSVVWRGEQPSVKREVAIKQIRSELASQPEFIRRFEAEAHLVARLEHPHIVPLIDFWRDPDSAYLVMRWLPGGTLERRLDDGALTVADTMKLAHQIGGALSTAHARGIVHRDVKTANILFDDEGNAFLADFGIALEATESAGPEAALSPGSPVYAAPEQIRGERLGPEADVFSLGVVIFECLTGSLPFPASSSVEEMIDRQLHTPYPPLAELRIDVPASVSNAVAKATSKAAGDRFASIAEFIAAFEPAVVGQSGETALRSPLTAPLGELDNPYLGLRAFADGDTDRFFGRERLVAQMLGRLSSDSVSSRCIVVVGPSGSGKSSVVRAGLMPALRADAVEGSKDWFTTTMVPGTDPFEALEAALLRVAVNPPDSLLGQLRDGRRGILRGVRRCLGADSEHLVVLIDQFEEIFTGASKETAHDFLDALAVAVDDPTSPLRLVATLRADYYHRPLEHPTFAAVLTTSAVDVTPLAADELEQAIVEPARRLGVGFEPGLVARIAAETVGQPSPLPLLQYTLSELFDRRPAGSNTLTIDAFDELGGLSGALSARADSIYERADDTERLAVRRIFGRMTNAREGSADLRQRVPVADLGSDDATAWVLEQFGAARLITFDRDVASREPTVEVAHEALMREWPRLGSWLTEDREVLRTADAIATAATVWDRGGRDATDLYRAGRLESAVDLAITAPDRLRPIDTEFVEASRSGADADRTLETRRVRRLRRLVLGVAAALVVALVAGGIAFRQGQRADDQADAARVSADRADDEAAAATAAAAQADAQTLVAEGEADAAQSANEQAELSTLISRSAALRGEDADVSVLLALEAHRRAPGAETEQAVLNALGSNDLPNRLSNLPALPDPDSECPYVDSWPDGTNEFSVTAEGTMITRDPLTAVVSEHGLAPYPCTFWMADLDQGFGVASDEDALRMSIGSIGPTGATWVVEKEFDDRTFFMSPSMGLLDRIPIVTFGDTPVVRLLDAATGEEIGAPIGAGQILVHDVASDDGTLFAVSFGTPDTPELDGATLVIDAESGAELFRFSSEQPAAAMVFDMEARELVAAIFPTTLMTIDLDTGEVVANVELPTGADFLEIGIRPDGLVTAVVNNEVLVVDRRTGVPVSRRELRDVLFAWLRPDGNLFTASAGDERTGVLDLEGNALIRETHSIDPFAKTTFNAGLMSTINAPTGSTVEVIDLASGERTVTELVTPDGAVITPHSVQADPGGLWSINSANVFMRWEDGRQVDHFELGGEGGDGTRIGDLYGYGWTDGDGDLQASLVDLGPDSPGVVFTVPTEGFGQAIPAPDGGLFFLAGDAGDLFRYDARGELVAEVSTTAMNTGIITLDPDSGKIAAATTRGIVSIIDPATGDTETLPTREPISNIGFGRDGELLALTGFDGTVRFWDIERSASAGVAWSGSGSVSGSPSFYDPETMSMWVTSSGRLLNIPLDPAQWIEQACDVVGRDLTQDEWDRFVPGDEPRQSACGREVVDEPEDVEDVDVVTGDSTEPSFAIETTVDFESDPVTGTFEVTAGSDDLGCSSGTVLENGGPDGITNEFTCEGGPGEGTFTIEWQIDDTDGPGDVNGPWTVVEATGDFAGLTGEGIWSGFAGEGPLGRGGFLGEISVDA